MVIISWIKNFYKMVQEYTSPTRAYEFPFEMVMQVLYTQLTFCSICWYFVLCGVNLVVHFITITKSLKSIWKFITIPILQVKQGTLNNLLSCLFLSLYLGIPETIPNV